MAPPGMKVIVHEKPLQRASWNTHGVDGWYVGPAMGYYCCYTCYITGTRGQRHSENVEFFPQRTTVPYHTPTDAVIQATQDIIRVLNSKSPITKNIQLGHKQLKVIQQLSDLFNQPRPNIQTNQFVPRGVVPPNPPAPPRVEIPI
jgi:hypothetical protein